MTAQLWILEKLSNFILKIDGLYGICIISQWCCYQKKKKSIDRMVNEWVNGRHFAMFKNKHIQEQNLKWSPPWARVVIEAPYHPAFLIPHTPSQAPGSSLAPPDPSLPFSFPSSLLLRLSLPPSQSTSPFWQFLQYHEGYGSFLGKLKFESPKGP